MNALITIALICWGIVILAAICAILDSIPAVRKTIHKLIKNLPLMQ